MTTPDYTKKMSELRTRVGQHAKLESNSVNRTIGVVPSIINNINTRSILFYITPPIILTILFLIIRPGFVYVEYTNDDNVIVKKMSFTKVLISGLISGTIISVGLFAYFQRKKVNI